MIKNLLLSLFLCTLSLFLGAYPVDGWAFTCTTSGGQTLGGPTTGGLNLTANVGVNLTPTLAVGANLIVDLSQTISCINQSGGLGAPQWDVIRAENGSGFLNSISGFSGTIRYYGSNYNYPLSGPTNYSPKESYGVSIPWQAVLYLTPLSGGAAGGVVINSGQYFASIKLHKVVINSDGSLYGVAGYPDDYTWNLYALNTVLIPTGGCDVSSRNVTVNLPDYPAGATSVPLTVHCAQNVGLAYYLTGTTANAANNVFTNTASGTTAQGIGVQLSNGSGILTANTTVSMGTVGTSPVDLGLTANYGLTGGQVTAGNVQSIIGVTFVYL